MTAIRDSSLENILPNSVYAYDHTFEVTFLSTHFLSILENTYTFSGGTHPEITNEAHTFSLQTGKELNLKNLFASTNIDVENTLKKFITNTIQDNPDAYFSDAINTINELPIDKFHFYINSNGIIIFFNPYEIAPYARGLIKFTIPL